MTDILQVLFWFITYVLIVAAGVCGKDEKKVSMPYAAGVLNLGWEACALQQSSGLWGHILWLGMDLAIVYIGFTRLSSTKQKVYYAASIYMTILILAYVFSLENGMLLSAFAIDLVLAIAFLLDRKKLSDKLKRWIAVTKLLGDGFAGLYYGPKQPVVAVLAVLILVCNVIYLFSCFRNPGTQNT